ncbi:MAG: DUF4403 family protein [Cytophagaceae bacterium]|nr:DUF4403 family protein [Cytophagaceae bacterium]
MNIMIRYLPLLGLVVLLACSSKKKQAPTQKEAFADPIPPELSYISAPILFPVDQLQDKINRALKPVLLNDQSYENHEGDNLKLRIERLGPLEIHPNGEYISYTVPLRITAEKRTMANLVKIKPTEFRVRVAFRSKVGVGPDWRLAIKTKFKNLTWLEKPSLNVMGLNVPLTNTIERIIERQAPNIETLIDRLVHDEVRIDQTVTRIWRNLQKPILVNRRHYSVWLQANPVGVMVGPVAGDTGKISIPIRITTNTQTLFGENPEYTVNPRLPVLKSVDAFPMVCELNLLSVLPYDELNEALSAHLLNRTLDLEKDGLVTIKKVNALGEGQNLVLLTELSGTMEGAFRLLGQPDYDTLKGSLTVKNFDFEVTSDGTLVNSANLALHDTLQGYVQSELNLPLKQYLARVPDLIQKAIERGKLGQKIDLYLTDFQMRPQRIVVRPEGVMTLIRVRTRVALRLQKI